MNQNADVDVEGLLNDNGEKNEKNKNLTPKIDMGNGAEEDDDYNDNRYPIIDELYQDFVLDLGDNIYLHKNTEIEEVKPIDKINK